MKTKYVNYIYICDYVCVCVIYGNWWKLQGPSKATTWQREIPNWPSLQHFCCFAQEASSCDGAKHLGHPAASGPGCPQSLGAESTAGDWPCQWQILMGMGGMGMSMEIWVKMLLNKGAGDCEPAWICFIFVSIYDIYVSKLLGNPWDKYHHAVVPFFHLRGFVILDFPWVFTLW